MGKDQANARDLAAWYSPALALGLLNHINFENVAKQIGPALASGHLTAAATTLTIGDAAMHSTDIPSSLWATWSAQKDLRFWATGNLIRPIEGSRDAINAFGVRLDPVGLALLFPNLGGPPAFVEAGLVSIKGGRPAGKNGEPIAGVAKRLLALTEADLASYTAEAVATELVEEYRRLHLQPPSSDNAKRDAAGILRAVRN
ncbi:hypothetical protein ACVWZA_003286 [Sphingomonas sp. UYAg733]